MLEIKPGALGAEMTGTRPGALGAEMMVRKPGALGAERGGKATVRRKSNRGTDMIRPHPLLRLPRVEMLSMTRTGINRTKEQDTTRHHPHPPCKETGPGSRGAVTQSSGKTGSSPQSPHVSETLEEKRTEGGRQRPLLPDIGATKGVSLPTPPMYRLPMGFKKSRRVKEG